MAETQLFEPGIFSYLEEKIKEEQQVRDTLTEIVQRLDRAIATAQGLLSRVHSTPRAKYPELVAQVEKAVNQQAEVVKELDGVASKHPYYKYNSKWSRTMQNAIGTTVYCAWLGGFGPSAPGQVGRLLKLEEVGQILGVPANLKTDDSFHLSLEEYLLSLTDLTNDLSRLATNSVTLGDFQLALVISSFVKDLFAGFQLLNLKNDILRKRADAVKYDVKRVEDVVYDLSLRGLVKREGEGMDTDA